MKDDILKGLFYLQEAPLPWSENLTKRIKENLLPKLVGYTQATEEPEEDVVDSATKIFG